MPNDPTLVVFSEAIELIFAVIKKKCEVLLDHCTYSLPNQGGNLWGRVLDPKPAMNIHLTRYRKVIVAAATILVLLGGVRFFMRTSSPSQPLQETLSQHDFIAKSSVTC